MIRVLVVSALAFAAAGLAACAHHHRGHGDQTAAASGPDACHASQYQSLIGKDESTITEASLPEKHRIVCFGCMSTMEFVPDRLTIYMGPGHKVASLHCG